MAGKNIFNKLLNYFNIGVKTKNNIKTITPTKPVSSNESGASKNGYPLKLNHNLNKFWEYWLSECHDDRNSLANRIERYRDTDYMYKNEPIVSMAVDLYSDEFTQADSQNKIIGVKAKKKEHEAYIYDLLERWGYTNADRLKTIARELALFGDSFFIDSLDDKTGFTDVTTISPFLVQDRIEFSLNDYIKSRKITYSIQGHAGKRIDLLLDVLDEKSKNKDLSYFFKSYLFGFKIDGEIVLPPWNVTHFRLNPEDSEFFPFGRPLVMNMIAPFRQLEASKTLMELARVAQFPTEVINVKTSENITPSEMWSVVNEAMREFENLSESVSPKDAPSIGKRLYCPDNLLSFDLKENRINTDSIKDIEFLRDDLIMGSKIPKGYLVVDRASFGTSGQALLQQYKPFGRGVYNMQSSFLNTLIEKIKLHLTVTEELNGADTDFELYMNFPVLEDSSDRLRMKQDTLRLANDVISNIQNALGTRDGLPADVIISVFSELSFLSPEDVEAWVKKSSESLNENGRPYISNENKLSENLKKSLNAFNENREEMINEAYFKARRKNRHFEGSNNGKHFVNSGKKIAKEYGLVHEVFSKEKIKDPSLKPKKKLK